MPRHASPLSKGKRQWTLSSRMPPSSCLRDTALTLLCFACAAALCVAPPIFFCNVDLVTGAKWVAASTILLGLPAAAIGMQCFTSAPRIVTLTLGVTLALGILNLVAAVLARLGFSLVLTGLVPLVATVPIVRKRNLAVVRDSAPPFLIAGLAVLCGVVAMAVTINLTTANRLPPAGLAVPFYQDS